MSFCRSLFVSFVVLFLTPTLLLAAHGVSIDGKLKYPPDFTHFDYVSVDAKKGGKLLLHDLGSFDKMNPFTLKGIAPFGLDMFVFEPLAVESLDEPFAKYGLIASDIEVAADKMSVIYTINPKARFSDGNAVTPEDVAFSLDTLKSDKVHPFYPYYYQDIQGAKVLDKQRVQFFFKRSNRELHMIASGMPVISKSFYTAHSFIGNDDSGHLVPPVGSGPYVVSNFVQGKSITYTKNPKYWAEDHPLQKGMYNFETITVNYYKDKIVALEAFKAGEFDFMLVNIAKQWARDMTGKGFDDGTLLKKRFPHKNNAGMQGFVMNTRRKIFSDVRVRQALGLAFDFKWTNKSLFYDQYTRCDSYFSNSYLAATGLPKGLELTYLEPFRKSLPKEVFTTELHAPTYEGKGGMRSNLRKALKLLTAAGWKIKDGQLKDADGNVFQFEILLVEQSFERVMAPYVENLKKLGMQVDYRTIDPALYKERVQNFDFDMTVHVYGQSLSPGNEQKNYWNSDAANQTGSKNLAGVQDPVVDNLVEKIIYANTQEELTAACKALDRVLWYGYYVVPNWYLNVHRIAFHKKFARPKTLPLYYNHIQLLMTWWMNKVQNSDTK